MTRLIIIGPDGCGKDTLARLVRDTSTLRYPEPTSLTWAREVEWWQDGRDIVEWWNNRRNNRDEWIDTAARLLREDGYTGIAKRVFKHADIYTGMRTSEELEDVLTFGLATGVVWVYNRGVTHNHGMQMTPELSCDIALAHGVSWCVASPTPIGAERVIEFLVELA